MYDIEKTMRTQRLVWDWRTLFIFHSVVLSSLFVCAMMSQSFNQNCHFLPLLLSFGLALSTGAHFARLYHRRKKGPSFFSPSPSVSLSFFSQTGWKVAQTEGIIKAETASQRLTVTEGGISASTVRGTSC